MAYLDRPTYKQSPTFKCKFDTQFKNFENYRPKTNQI